MKFYRERPPRWQKRGGGSFNWNTPMNMSVMPQPNRLPPPGVLMGMSPRPPLLSTPPRGLLSVPFIRSRPPSPLPGSEEARQRTIAEASARIKEQLNLSEPNTYNIINQSNVQRNIINTCDNVISEPKAVPKPPEQNKRKIRQKSVNINADRNVNVHELRNKIVKGITSLSKGKIQSIVNNPGSTKYDAALQHLVRDMRLHLSSELRTMYNNRSNESGSMIDHFNSLVPDLGVELASLPDTLVDELSNILQLDMNNMDLTNMDSYAHESNMNVQNETPVDNLIEPEHFFKQAEIMLSNSNFNESEMDLQSTLENFNFSEPPPNMFRYMNDQTDMNAHQSCLNYTSSIHDPRRNSYPMKIEQDMSLPPPNMRPFTVVSTTLDDVRLPAITIPEPDTSILPPVNVIDANIPYANDVLLENEQDDVIMQDTEAIIESCDIDNELNYLLDTPNINFPDNFNPDFNCIDGNIDFSDDHQIDNFCATSTNTSLSADQQITSPKQPNDANLSDEPYDPEENIDSIFANPKETVTPKDVLLPMTELPKKIVESNVKNGSSVKIDFKQNTKIQFRMFKDAPKIKHNPSVLNAMESDSSKFKSKAIWVPVTDENAKRTNEDKKGGIRKHKSFEEVIKEKGDKGNKTSEKNEQNTSKNSEFLEDIIEIDEDVSIEKNKSKTKDNTESKLELKITKFAENIDLSSLNKSKLSNKDSSSKESEDKTKKVDKSPNKKNMDNNKLFKPKTIPKDLYKTDNKKLEAVEKYLDIYDDILDITVENILDEKITENTTDDMLQLKNIPTRDIIELNLGRISPKKLEREKDIIILETAKSKQDSPKASKKAIGSSDIDSLDSEEYDSDSISTSSSDSEESSDSEKMHDDKHYDKKHQKKDKSYKLKNRDRRKKHSSDNFHAKESSHKKKNNSERIWNLDERFRKNTKDYLDKLYYQNRAIDPRYSNQYEFKKRTSKEHTRDNYLRQHQTDSPKFRSSSSTSIKSGSSDSCCSNKNKSMAPLSLIDNELPKNKVPLEERMKIFKEIQVEKDKRSPLKKLDLTGWNASPPKDDIKIDQLQEKLNSIVGIAKKDRHLSLDKFSKNLVKNMDEMILKQTEDILQKSDSNKGNKSKWFVFLYTLAFNRFSF